MAIYDPIDTLAYQKSRVLQQSRSMAHIPMALVAGRMQAVMDNPAFPKEARPETEAIGFYGMNHAVALLSGRYAEYEPMRPADVALFDDYHKRMAESALRAFYYLMLICTREARHDINWSNSANHAGKTSVPLANWMTSIVQGENAIHKKMMSSPPNCRVGHFVEQLRWAFYNSKWPGGFGGPKWGQVTDCLVNFVNGTYTAEMMLDTVWTLAHNGGPIFNKGHLYSMYTPALYNVLDVQRSGQIPELVMSANALSTFVPNWMVPHMVQLRNDFPKDIGTYIDWFKVEALGAVKSYEPQKQAQLQAHGPSQYAGKMDQLKEQQKAAAKLKLEQEKAAKKAAKQQFEQDHFEVTPGVYLKKIKRKVAA